MVKLSVSLRAFVIFVMIKKKRMRKIVLLCVVMFSAPFWAIAQLELGNVVWEVTGSLDVPEDDEIVAEWDVINAGSSAVSLRARRTMIYNPEPFNLPYDQNGSGARERFCWGPLCYQYGTSMTPATESLLVTIEPGASNNTFKGLYEHMGVAGAAQVRYCFFDVNNPSLEICQEVLYCVDAEVCALSVSDYRMPELSNMGPNPVIGRSAFNYDLGSSSGEREVVIYNMVGAQVQRIPLNNPVGTVFITADDYDAGIYFYALLVNGTPVSTKKFIVSK